MRLSQSNREREKERETHSVSDAAESVWGKCFPPVAQTGDATVTAAASPRHTKLHSKNCQFKDDE